MNQYDLSINRVKLWLLLSHKTKLLTLPANFATRKYLYKFFFFWGEEELFTRVPEIIWHEEVFWKVIRVDAKNQLTIGANRRASRKKKRKENTHLYKPRRQDSPRHKGLTGKKRRRSSLPTIQMEIKGALTWNRGKKRYFF